MKINIIALSSTGEFAIQSLMSEPMSGKEKFMVKRRIASKSPLTMEYRIRLPNMFWNNPLVKKVTSESQLKKEYYEHCMKTLAGYGCGVNDVEVRVLE